MESNLIQWPRGKYWTDCFNPIIGCRKISPACENCYAEAFVKRFNMTGCTCVGGEFEPTRKPACKLPKKGVVFCGNITDLFGSWVTPEEQSKWFDMTWDAYDKYGHNAFYLWLTKRPGNMAEAIYDNIETIPLDISYFGITTENQEMYDKRTEQLFDIKHRLFAKNYWLSCEPLLGPVDLALDVSPMEFSWVVVGCESGRKRRHTDIKWVESIVEQCKAAKVPVFVKQLEIDGKCTSDITKFPTHLQIRQVPWRGKYNCGMHKLV